MYIQTLAQYWTAIGCCYAQQLTLDQTTVHAWQTIQFDHNKDGECY